MLGEEKKMESYEMLKREKSERRKKELRTKARNSKQLQIMVVINPNISKVFFLFL